MTNRVDVVMPAYNAEATISEAIESVLAQTYPHWTLWVADDGSADGTRDLVQAFADERIRFLALEHSGLPSVVRNRAIAEGHGELIAFLDADDLWMADKLERQVACLDSDARIGAVFCPYLMWRPEEGDRMSAYPENRSWDSPGDYFDALLLENFIPTPAMLFRRSLLEPGETAFDSSPELRIGEDYDLWLRLAERTCFGVVEKPLVTIRTHAANMTRDRRQTVLAALPVLERADARKGGRLRRRPIWRRAVSNRFLFLGRRSLLRGERGGGIRDLLAALRRDPCNLQAWKWLFAAPFGRRVCAGLWRRTGK